MIDPDYRPPREAITLGEDYYISHDGWLYELVEADDGWYVSSIPEDGPGGSTRSDKMTTREEAEAHFRQTVTRAMMRYMTTPTELGEQDD